MPLTSEQILTTIASIKAQLDALAIAVAGTVAQPQPEVPSTTPTAQAGNILTLKSSSGKENVTTGTAKVAVGMMVKFANGRSTPVMSTDDGITFTTREPAADSEGALKKLAGSNLTVVSVPGDQPQQETPKPVEEPKPDPVQEPKPTNGNYMRTQGRNFVNLGMGAGADHVIPGKEGTNYGMPSDNEIKRALSYGFKEFRIGFLMGRVYKGTGMEMYRGQDPNDKGRMMTMDNMLRIGRTCKKLGATIMWDNHCYGFFPSNGAPGRIQVTPELLANHWYGVIQALREDPEAWAATTRFDILNEPYTISGPDLAKIYQAVIDKCAPISDDKIFVLEGPNYSSATNWVSGCGAAFAKITHPRGKQFIEFSAHCYYDAGYDGYYTEGDQINSREKSAGVSYEKIGEYRTAEFIAWKNSIGANASIGETMVPGRLPMMIKAAEAGSKVWMKEGVDTYWFGMSDWFGNNEHNIELESNKPTLEMIKGRIAEQK